MNHDNFGAQFAGFLIAVVPVVVFLIWAASVYGTGNVALAAFLFSYISGAVKGVFLER